MQVHTPVVPTQAIYRQVLQAMSHPGKLYSLPLREWSCSMLALCETLLDHEVSYCVTASGDSSWETDIFALTKACMAKLEDADYIIVKGHTSNGALSRVRRGDPAFPDQGATIIYVMESPLPAAEGCGPILSGPGLAKATASEVNPLAENEWRALREVNSEYPLGVDVICLLGCEQVMCIPRSTEIKVD